LAVVHGRGWLRRRTTFALLAALLAVLAGSGTAWANVPRHRFVYEVTANITVADPGAIAVNPATGIVYVVSARGLVYVISGATNTVIATIPLLSASAIAVDPATNMVYVTRGSDLVSVINGTTNQVTASILFGLPGAGPTGIAVNPATNTIYVSSSGNSAPAVSVINGTTNTVTAIIPLPAGDYPVDLAADPGTNTIAVAAQYGCCGGVLMINGATRTVTTVNLYEPQYAVGIDTSTGIYYAEGIGDLSSVNAQTYAAGALPAFPCPVGSCGGSVNQLSVDSALHTIYVSFNENGTDVVLVLDGFTGGAYASVPVPGANQLAVNSMTHTAYVDSGYNAVTVISRVWV
jgi:YVTN family beta-propeller protein